MADFKVRGELTVKDKGSKQIQQFSKNATSSFSNISKAAKSLAGPIALGAVLIGLTKIIGKAKELSKTFLDAARTTENYKIRLNALLGSTKKGNQLFKDMATFASQVPFEYEKIMGAATQLSGVMGDNVEQINSWMPLIADLAVVAGEGIEKTTEQVVRMYSSGAQAAEIFKEKGILSMLGFQAGVSYSAAETQRVLVKAWTDSESKFRGATKAMAKSWDGLMSMINDKWFQFRQMIMDSEVYDYLKEQLSIINDEFGEWLRLNEDIIKLKVSEYVEKIREIVREITPAVRGMWRLAKATAQVAKNILNSWPALKIAYELLKLMGKEAKIAGSEIDELKKKIEEYNKMTNEMQRGMFIEEHGPIDDLIKQLEDLERGVGASTKELLSWGDAATKEVAKRHAAGLGAPGAPIITTKPGKELTAREKELEEAKKFAEDKKRIEKEYNISSKQLSLEAWGYEAALLETENEYYIEQQEEQLKIKQEFQDKWLTTLDKVAAEEARKIEEQKQKWVDFGDSVASSLGNAFGNFAVGAQTAEDAFKSFAQSVIAGLADIAAQELAKTIISGLISSWGSGAGDAGTWGGDPGGGFLAAKGGIASGGFKAFQDGGMVTRPTLGLIGEGSMNEAVVPLPNGRSIPVEQKGGGGEATQNTFIIQAMDSKSFVEFTRRNPAAIIAPLTDSVNKGSGGLRNTLKKAVR